MGSTSDSDDESSIGKLGGRDFTLADFESDDDPNSKDKSFKLYRFYLYLYDGVDLDEMDRAVNYRPCGIACFKDSKGNKRYSFRLRPRNLFTPLSLKYWLWVLRFFVKRLWKYLFRLIDFLLMKMLELSVFLVYYSLKYWVYAVFVFGYIGILFRIFKKVTGMDDEGIWTNVYEFLTWVQIGRGQHEVIKPD